MLEQKQKALFDKLLKDYTSRKQFKKLNSETKLEKNLGITGDDGVDFIDEFVELFKITVTPYFDYSRYFAPEGTMFIGFFSSDRIDLTVRDLEDIIVAGCML